MWIKDCEGNYIRAAEVAMVGVAAEANEYTLNIAFKGYETAVIVKFYRRKEGAEAARDELIRRLGGEVIEV